MDRSTMGKEININPLSNLLFNHTQIACPEIPVDEVECKTKKELSKTNTLFPYCFEIGNTLVFYKNGTLGSSNLFELPISNIISTEVSSEKKMMGKKWFLTIKTTVDTIVIKMEEIQANICKTALDSQKEKEKRSNQSKEITFTSGGTLKNITVNPYSPISQEGEEEIESIPAQNGESGIMITNYRVFTDDFFNESISQYLTHDEYEDVIASNVEKRREEEIVGGVDSKPSAWNYVSSSINIHYNKSTHHSSSTEVEFGNIIFMNDGKQVMVWKNINDPNSIVQKIKSAKSHFQIPSAKTSENEDPLKALKLRLVKGEITKEEFTEMKSMIE
jgi:hypothetical protein